MTTTLSVPDKILAAKTRLMWDHPFFGSLVSHLTLVDATDNPAITTMATDGKHLFYDEAFVTKLKLKQLQFVLAHECMHNALEHHTRIGNRDHRRFNEACDYAINGELVNCKVGEMPDDGLIDDNYTGMGAEEIYNLLGQKPDDASGKQNGKGQPGDGNSQPSGDPGQCGQILPAAAPTDQAGLDKAKQEARIQVRQAAAVAKRAAEAGKLPGAIEELIGKLTEPVIDWRDRLRSFTDDSQRKDYSFASPNRNLLPMGIVFPGLVPDGISHLVVAIDTSASIDQAMLRTFGGEIDGIFGDGGIDKLTIIYADTKVQRVETFEVGDEPTFAATGRGGTSFVDTFRYVSDELDDASCFIYFTDLEVTAFGAEPSCPVLWAVYGDSRKFDLLAAKAPFGEAIHINAN